MHKTRTLLLSSFLILTGVVACAGPVRGPDKQFGGGLEGAATGAATGAVTGFHLGAGTGPGAAVGAGFGAVAGSIHGYAKDSLEENLMDLAEETEVERARSVAHEILNDHYQRRAELHPSRDIFPADLFFDGDSVHLGPRGAALVKEIAVLNENRMPWSRLVVAVYTKAIDENSEYANHIATERSRAIGLALVRAGIEPRRISTRAVVVDAPVLIDPADNPARYNQAIELIPIDR